jgi:hypothetical protein
MKFLALMFSFGIVGMSTSFAADIERACGTFGYVGSDGMGVGLNTPDGREVELLWDGETPTSISSLQNLLRANQRESYVGCVKGTAIQKWGTRESWTYTDLEIVGPSVVRKATRICGGLSVKKTDESDQVFLTADAQKWWLVNADKKIKSEDLKNSKLICVEGQDNTFPKDQYSRFEITEIKVIE